MALPGEPTLKGPFPHSESGCRGDGGPRELGGAAQNGQLPGGSERGDFRAVYSLFQDKHCMYPLSRLLTFVVHIGHAIDAITTFSCDHEAESWRVAPHD